MNKRIMSLLLAVLLMIGFIPKMNIANAVEIESIELGDLEGGAQSTTGAQVTVDYNEDEEELKDGLYSIDYSAYKDGTTNNSSVGNYIVESNLKVKKGKMTIMVTFKSASMLSNMSAKVNGNTVKVSQTETVDDQFTIEFEIGSLTDKISIGLSVTVPSYGVMNHSFDYVINEITFKEAIDDDAVTTLKDGNYTVETNILKTGTNETSVASAYLEKESNLKVEKGQYILTLNIKDIKVMSNIKVTVDGKNVEFDTVRDNDGTGSISFKINALRSNILVACTVSVPEIGYNSNVDFNVALDTSTIKDENGGGIELPDENNAGVPLYKNATYTIENEINTESMPESAAYLDPKSTIEVEDGYIYLTLSFNMSGFMDSRYIKLNDNSSVTRYTVVNDNNRSVIRFKISSLSDKIHISSKNKSIDEGFTIGLLKETLVEKITEVGNGSSSDDEDDDDEDDDDDLDDGTYTIKNKALKENSNATSDARAYLDDESIITVKNGKIYLTLKFTHGKMMSDTSIKVEGKKTSYTTVKKSGNKFYIKFKIGSLSDEVLVTSTIDTGIPAIGTLKGTKFRVLLRESTLEEDDDADEDDDDDEDEDDEETDEEDNNSNVNSAISDSSINNVGTQVNTNGSLAQDSSAGSNGAQYKKATYKVNNEIVTDSAIGYQAARGAINKVSYFEIENDTKNYITLGFNQTDIMDNIRLQINGNKVDYEIVNQDKSNKTMEIRFPVPSISTEVTVTTTITAMGRDTTFGVKFLESTLELISVEESDSEIINNQVAGKLSSVANTESNVLGSKLDLKSAANSVSNADVEAVLENSDITSEAKEYFKRYTVNNEVLSDSSMGRMMARKYLNETSIIEEIDGNLYATITFSSASSMGNFKIEVGGKEVQHSVVLKDESNGLISLRFPITSVNDDIRVYIYINPMKMNIDFGVKLLQDTMILIEEGTVGLEGSEEKTTGLIENLAAINKENSNNNNISTWKIVVFTSVLSTILNFSVGGIIYLIIRKRRNNKKINTNN